MNSIIWALGFRPFFLFGSLSAIFLVSYWAIVFFTGSLPSGYFDPIQWHAHEMIFGFTISIVAGFLLTASANWTRSKPLEGKKLMLLFLTWVLGRLLILLSIFDLPIPPWIYFLGDMLFIPGLILALAPSLIKARQLRNIQFLFVLALLAYGNSLMHLSALGLIDPEYSSKSLYLGVNLILLIIVIIGGRVVPFFSANAIKGMVPVRNNLIEKLSIFTVCLYVLFDFIEHQTNYAAYAAVLAGVVNLIRLILWKPWLTLSNPLVWILHLGYLWIVAGFFLIFTSDVLFLLPRSVAVHAFTAGAMGTFIIGMISRVTLGHTGRPLKLPSGFSISYHLMICSGIIRVGSGFYSEYYSMGILISGILWGLSFLMYAIYYTPILLSPRPDGRPG